MKNVTAKELLSDLAFEDNNECVLLGHDLFVANLRSWLDLRVSERISKNGENVVLMPENENALRMTGVEYQKLEDFAGEWLKFEDL